MADRLLLEDGSGILLLEDGSGGLLLEDSAVSADQAQFVCVTQLEQVVRIRSCLVVALPVGSNVITWRGAPVTWRGELVTWR